MDDEGIPPIPNGAPWPPEFVAALHAGCYDDDASVERLWHQVRLDPEATQLLERLDAVQRTLRSLRG